MFCGVAKLSYFENYFISCYHCGVLEQDRNNAHPKIRQPEQLLPSAVDEKTKNFPPFSNTQERRINVSALLKTGLSSDIIAESPNRTKRGISSKIRKPKPNSPSPVDNDNQKFLSLSPL